MKKICFEGNFSDNSFEGMIKIVKLLKKGISKKYKIIDEIKSCESADLVHVHSSGFYEAIKSSSKKEKIFSLHSNVGITIRQNLRDEYDNYTKLYSLY